VDATPRGEEPGTLYVIEPDLRELNETDTQTMMVEGHDMNPLKVLAMVKSMGGEFKKVLLVGCEPETLGPEEGQLGLSGSVTAAVNQAVILVELGEYQTAKAS
jgi:hydrogenase maturation protease